MLSNSLIRPVCTIKYIDFTFHFFIPFILVKVLRIFLSNLTSGLVVLVISIAILSPDEKLIIKSGIGVPFQNFPYILLNSSFISSSSNTVALVRILFKEGFNSEKYIS